jgi:uncharacterized protein (TIGR02246 family)
MADDTRSVIERFHDAFNAHDLDALADIWSEDCVFEDTSPPDGTQHTGRDAVLQACRDFFAQSPNARFEIEGLDTVGDRAFVQWRYAWADGHVRGVDLMRVRDGKVSESFAYVKG